MTLGRPNAGENLSGLCKLGPACRLKTTQGVCCKFVRKGQGADRDGQSRPRWALVLSQGRCQALGLLEALWRWMCCLSCPVLPLVQASCEANTPVTGSFMLSTPPLVVVVYRPKSVWERWWAAQWEILQKRVVSMDVDAINHRAVQCLPPAACLKRRHQGSPSAGGCGRCIQGHCHCPTSSQNCSTVMYTVIVALQDLSQCR